MSQNFTKYPWAPQTISDIDFSDCGKNVLILWHYYVEKNPLVGYVEDPDAYQALSHGLQGYWLAHGFEPPPQSQLLQWGSHTFDSPDGLEYLFSSGACKGELCPLIGWEGSSDIAGQGVRL
jgi:hypothetical protein